MELTREEAIEFVAACEGVEEMNDLMCAFCRCSLEDTTGKTADITKIVEILIKHAKEYMGVPSDPSDRDKTDAEVSEIIRIIQDDGMETEEKAMLLLGV